MSLFVDSETCSVNSNQFKETQSAAKFCVFGEEGEKKAFNIMTFGKIMLYQLQKKKTSN